MIRPRGRPYAGDGGRYWERKQAIMRRLNRWSALGLSLALGCAYGIEARRPLVDLQQAADLIVVGSASDGLQVGPGVSFTLQVERVVKGDAIMGSVIPVQWVVQASRLAPPVVAGHGLWFLQQASSGWTLLPVMHGTMFFDHTFIPEPAGEILTPYRYGSGAALSDRIASEVSAAIESGNGGGPLMAYLQFNLDHLGSPVAMTLYRRMAASPSSEQKILGLSGLIRGGDPTALEGAAQLVGSSPRSSIEMGVLLTSIGDELRTVDPRSVAILGKCTLPSNTNLAFRKAAAHALRSIHTMDALPFLAALLDDPDPELRAEGAGGLASFANGLSVQTTADAPSMRHMQLPKSARFKTDETVAHLAMGEAALKHVAFWKDWWAQNKAALGY